MSIHREKVFDVLSIGHYEILKLVQTNLQRSNLIFRLSRLDCNFILQCVDVTQPNVR